MAVEEETLRLASGLRIVIAEQTDAYERRLVRQWARAWDALYATWSDAMMDLASAGIDGHWPSRWVVSRSRKAEQALAAALDSLTEIVSTSEVEMFDAVGKIVQLTPEHQVRIIASQVPQIPEAQALLSISFDRVDQTALDAIVERTTKQITAVTRPLPAMVQAQMREVLVSGVAVGDNPRKAARIMVRRAEGAFNGGLTRALTIARTEMLDAYRSSAAATEWAHEELVGGWKWLATLDSRTCPSCWGMNGTEHNLQETGPDDHQCGRCARITVVRPWSELGFPDIEEPASIFPDAQAEFAALSRDEQLAIMGPTRLQALDDGLIGWGDLSTRRSTAGWRDSWAPTPVGRLLASRG
ncbi:phage minor head protein [Actinotalea sp. M2MS4P-6]|uniref:phage minor head protein n=1 Tax=Actinotalea sp. M2MS4P-6 TaxID=2983762 RepID=UPI0021E360FE|nr:phage minor head protein [Actinotalea sp. M2MS4P-6]MCV2395932.1 phage minor head protein [Actinotalea sp. M2MS4P-6]